MAKRKKKKDPLMLYVRKGATLREIYAQLRREFTAADLQKYTEPDEGIDFGAVLPELEEIHRRESSRRRKK